MPPGVGPSDRMAGVGCSRASGGSQPGLRRCALAAGRRGKRPRGGRLAVSGRIDPHDLQRSLCGPTRPRLAPLGNENFVIAGVQSACRAVQAATTTCAVFAVCNQLMSTIQSVPVPVIAAPHGIATAAGCQLVAACDLAIASVDCRFATSGVKYGLFCSTPGVAVARNVSRKHALDMLL